ncbi:hypothetical protein MMC30_005408 [Trapelia coarctata]|nr:hypothetical protein [Trapelia coarctata]
MTLSMLYFVAAVLQTLLFCDPFFANWDSAAPEAVCGDRLAAFVAVGTINLLIDVTVIILPMPMLWALRLPVAKKLGLTAIFGIGVVICIISVIRVVTLAQINTTDFSYRLGQIGYWSVLEPTLGIISCCLPVLPPVLSKLLGPSPTFEMQHPASNDTGRFNRMPDDVEGTYPLTSRSESFQKSEAYGGRPSGNYSEVSLGRERGDVPPVPAPGVVMGMGMGIVVERAFSVATTRTRDEEGVGRAL